MNTSRIHPPSRTQILRRFLGVFTLFLIATLVACGGGGGGGGDMTGQPDAAITAQPTDQNVVMGATATFTVVASNAISYQWQSSTDDGTTFVNVSGATAASYTTATTILADDGTQYRVVVSGAGNSVTSSAVKLTVSPVVVAPAISAQPAGQTITEEQGASFFVTASGTSLGYQWQRSTDSGANFANVVGATNATLTLTAVPLADNAHQFRVVVSNSAGSVTSNAALLTVNPTPAIATAITAQPTDQNVVAGATATFTVVASNATGYQWQRSTNGGATFANVSGATAASYTTATTILADDGTQYRVVVSGASNSVTSSAVTLAVTPVVEAPAISVQPAGQTITEGQDVSFSVTASGTSIGYQWQHSTDGGANFANVVGATNATLTLTAVPLVDNAHQFRVVVSNSAGSVTSNAALLTVNSATGGGAGTFTFETFAFYQPVLLSGADGVLHLVFHTNEPGSTVQYARCASECGIGANWTVTIIGSDQFTGSTRMVIGTDNRLHLLYYSSAGGLNPAKLVYATCATNCTQLASWATTDLASLFGGSWDRPTNGEPLVIDSQNRLTFTVDRKSYPDGGVTLATCTSDCGTVGNWSVGVIRASGTRTVLAAHGTTLHQIIDNGTTSGKGTSLAYRTCTSNCTLEASWQELPNLFVYDGEMPLAIAVTAQGGVRVVYNQGPSDANQPAPIKAQDNKMLVWGCDANCLQVSSWSGFVTGAVDDGAKGISLAEQQGSMVIAITNTSRVFTSYCGENCLTAANWQSAEVDNTAAITAEYDPYALTAVSCSGTRPSTATWHYDDGVVAIRPDGSVAFAHAAHILRTCIDSTTIQYVPGYGRFVFAP